MPAFACYSSSPSPFGSVASATPSPFGSNPSPPSTTVFGTNSNPGNIDGTGFCHASPFGSNPSPFGGNGLATNSSSVGSSGVPSPFGSKSLFGGNAFTAGTLCNTNLGFCPITNDLGRGSSIASYRATNPSDCPKSVLQSISSMDAYANKSHEELRHEDYRMNNKGRPKPMFGSFGRPSGFGFHFPSADSTSDLPTRNLFEVNPSDRFTRDPFSPSPFTRNPFSPQTANYPFLVPSANLFPTSTTTPTPNNAFYDAPSKIPFPTSLPPFCPPKPNNVFPLAPQTQGFYFPTNTSTPTPNSTISFSPSTNSRSTPASVPPPAGNINWGPFATFAPPLPQNNVEARIATPTVFQTPCQCCSLTKVGPCSPVLNASKPEVVSTTNSSQPSQASSGLAAVKEVGSQEKNGQPETVASVETVVSVGMASLSVGLAPTNTNEKGEAAENKTRASFRVNVNCIDIDDVSSIMPRLPPGKEYYTEPSIEQLEAKERAEPGYCSRVKDFVVGRKDKGSIKFLGETDVSELDLESIVQFNDREVVVYLDETKMPPVGQGLNKPAEVTLLNVKCISKLTGKQYVDGPQLRKYEQKLMEKTAEIGGEFLSFDPVKGQWNFKVLHF